MQFSVRMALYGKKFFIYGNSIVRSFGQSEFFTHGSYFIPPQHESQTPLLPTFCRSRNFLSVTNFIPSGLVAHKAVKSLSSKKSMCNRYALPVYSWQLDKHFCLFIYRKDPVGLFRGQRSVWRVKKQRQQFEHFK